MEEKSISVKQIHGPSVEYVFSTPENSKDYIKILTNEEPRKTLCVLPSKLSNSDDFKEKYSFLSDTEFRFKEFIEGTFMCIFYDERICGWEIASKNSIGCNYWYIRNQYKVGDFDRQLTFRQMLIECLGEPFNKDFNEISFLKDLSKSHVYHFVIQHPTNKMIINIQKPKAYLVDVYEIVEENVKHMSPEEYSSWSCFKDQENIFYPKCYNLESLDYDNIKNKFDNNDLQGIVVSHIENNEQTILEDESYSKIKELRGNHPNLQYLYLSLIKENKITEFLNVFTIYKNLFDKFRQELFEFVCELHKQYISYYVHKRGEKVPKKYFPLVYRLHHEVFLIKKEQDPSFILKRKEVDVFFKIMDVGSMIFYLNQ